MHSPLFSQNSFAFFCAKSRTAFRGVACRSEGEWSVIKKREGWRGVRWSFWTGSAAKKKRVGMLPGPMSNLETVNIAVISQWKVELTCRKTNHRLLNQYRSTY